MQEKLVARLQEILNTSDNKTESGMKMYDEPILGFADASDEIFNLFKEKAVGSHYVLPNEWLESAKTVVSVFLPFSEELRNSNKLDPEMPSEEWLYGRIEGQKLVNKICTELSEVVAECGYACACPTLTPKTSEVRFSSCWSERHTAFACGIGTFGLSKGLITEKGMAGRLFSLIISAELEPTPRTYKDINEYCTMCGKCIKNCPASAISKDGKVDKICSDYLDITKEKFAPRYGCGKCQVNVPCEAKKPRRN